MSAKLKLHVDDLMVDSFDTSRSQKPGGTVFGEEQCTCWTQCGQNTCPGCPTCDHTCAQTCDDATCAGCSNASCYATCGATCGNTCNDTCGCYPETACQNTGCGNSPCCI